MLCYKYVGLNIVTKPADYEEFPSLPLVCQQLK